ncbi:Trm112 family protein [Desulfomicrobium escambiense]|uniref:Trm112 family protein n=1 Tax=Desulfomicrobium escambiense TaxID=29503 RepID=UPI0003F8CA1F|nr:Trm112 family protein [Desulfomicrobium escambiense]
MALNKELLQILACPKCKGGLELLDREEGLKCAACGLVYPVREEIPVMLIDEAVPVARWEQGVRENKA